MQLILVAIFLTAIVHSYSYHTYENVNVNDNNKKIFDKIEIVLETDENFNSSAANSRKRFITYVNDGINSIFADCLGTCRNLFGATIEDVAILNGTDTEVTNKVTELTAFIDSMEKLEKEKSSINAKFNLMGHWFDLLLKYNSKFQSLIKQPTVVDVLFYTSLQKNGLNTSRHQIWNKFRDFIENFNPIAADWYGYTKSLSGQNDGFNLWYRSYSNMPWQWKIYNFDDILKLYSEFN